LILCADAQGGEGERKEKRGEKKNPVRKGGGKKREGGARCCL